MSTPNLNNRPDDDMGNVVPLRPATEPTNEIEPQIIDAEIVDDDAPGWGRVPGTEIERATPRTVALVTAVRQSQQLAKVRQVAAYRARHAHRDAWQITKYTVRGHARWFRKGWDWATHADLRADARAAKLSQDRETRRVAQEMLKADGRARWERLGVAARRTAVALAVVAGVVAVLWLLGQVMPREQMWPWLAFLYTVPAGIAAAANFVWVWLFWPIVIAWVAAAVYEGRDKTPGVGWLHRPDRDDADSWVDERMISQALAHLGVPPLDRFFKSGGELVYSVPARVDGDGTFAQVRLPMGVTAEMVASKRKTLAANLGRASLETWPTQGDEDGVLDLWVADKGKLGGGAGMWPLQHDGIVDLFDGVPFGLTQRGMVVNAPLFEANWLIGGRPGQGKSAAMRTLLLGAGLDPTAELWVYVMGQSPDFDPFTPRLSRYAMGMDDSVALAVLDGLRDLLSEMERRGKVLGQQPGKPPKVSRKLANNPKLGLHPLVCAIDECHEAFMHPKYGKEIADLAVRLIKRGRKYGIILVLATQSPTKDSIPREVTRNVSCGVAFAVADHVANDGLLGSGKYKAGIRATDLRMKTDRGTCVAVGVTDNVFELVRTFYVPFEDGNDQVTPVINRAMAEIGELNRTGHTDQADDEIEQVDHLADIADALRGERRVRTQVVLGRLAEANSAEYEDWSFTDLAAALAEHGIEPRKSDGYKVIRAEDVTTALTERDEDGDERAGI
ncbi:DNA segregation ATPase FtsK/SpoIIIE, S-DNA-T family [Actinokineospora alba]|uniref:DNA segregation ATPase FtsK/SpoIIIE, S-DNA-T family n=1 Tax=Actinokineospora alba TaxID=504798 RepID=A0A1H0VAI4_9PSEU|nr:hypothetical protein [Actinokineospora alba]TDP65585.1 S-DNA-T family DNA segregation ATPase FtsK/SpoIIIE [Actinokineospora alba]SDH66049.1 DNA segregation ATPase FtsK/SpoIIIE, S-DNA-T family [Actinokineospora alba]SDP75437.1 DNA segregation ATPase FtsK/SpoIIIE, S-DNA-T family [Actinokineospora alba]